MLVCERRLAELDRRRGDLRLHHHIRFLLDAGWDVSFLAFRRDADLRYARILQQMGVNVTVGREHIEAVVRETQPDVALTYMWFAGEQMLPWLRGRSPGAKVVVDTGDLDLLRRSRTCFRDANAISAPGASFGIDAARELNTYALADAVLAVSEKERRLVDELTGRPGLASVVPLAEATPRSPVACPERRGVVFVGNFLHAPNVEAIEHFVTRVLPHLALNLLADHPVIVLGHGLTPEIRDLAADRSCIRMIGWVPDLTPYLHRARVVVVPLLTGAGVKGKLLQALSAGTPVVTTSVGIEGTAAVADRHVLVADDPAEFADALLRLLTDDGLWRRLSHAGHGAVRHHRPDIVRTLLLDTLSSLL